MVENLEGEIWKDIEGYEGMYQVSNYGRVKNLERYSAQNHLLPEKLLSITHAAWGYCDVSLYKNGVREHKKPHRLVAEAFIPNPDNLPEVDHIDTNKDNNRADNLRWCTHQENHMNPLTRKLKHDINVGKKLTPEAIEKLSKKVEMYKDGILVHTFSSFADILRTSEELLGEKLWPHYARHVIQGKRKDYKGYIFKLA